MTSLSLTLSDSLKDFLEAQVAAGGYRSASDYIQALLQAAQKQQAWARVEDQILDGLNSGEGIEATEEYWEGKRRQLKERYPEADQP